MAIWMVYAAAAAALLAGGGFALERICEARGWPLRFVWLAALTLAVVLPMNADPPEPVRDSPTHATDIAQTAPVAGDAAELAPAAPAGDRRGKSVALASFASRAPLIGWGLASLLALAMLATVLLASASARRRWERRRIGSEDVYVSHRFGPALVGIARPSVVVPRWVLGLGEAIGATVVKHEREHARAGDHLALLYAALVAAALPWSPAIWWMCRRLGAAIEIDCDHRVMASGTPANDYGNLLLGIGAGRRARCLFALNLADSGSLLERRLRTISGGSSKLGLPTAVMLGGLAVVSAAAACDLPAPTSVASAVGETLGVRTEAPAEARSRSTDPDAFGPLDQLPWTEDGTILIRGRSPSPSLGLGVTRVAANPLVILNDNVVPGGLRSLLSMMDTLDFGWVGTVAGQDAIELFGPRAANGAVVIRTRSSAGGSVGPVRQRHADRWDVAAQQWKAARQGWRQAAQVREDAARDLKSARPGWEESDREGRQATDLKTAAFQNATGPDGRVRIQGTDSLPAITLRADVAARNPRVQVDGEFVEGGLRKLLTMMDTLNFVSGGYYGFPPRVVINTEKRRGSR